MKGSGRVCLSKAGNHLVELDELDVLAEYGLTVAYDNLATREWLSHKESLLVWMWII